MPTSAPSGSPSGCRRWPRSTASRSTPADLDTIASIQIENGLFADAERTISVHRPAREGTTRRRTRSPNTCSPSPGRSAGWAPPTGRRPALDECRALCVERELGDVLVRVHQEQAELHAARGEFAEAFADHKVFFAAHDGLHSSQREAQARTRQAMFETAEARQEAERFREQARRDPLTGLRNRRYVDEQLPGLIADPAPVAIAIVDLDHFKRVNDQLSHDVGDQVLVPVAKLLETELAAVAPDGFVARMGGEEFLMVLPGIGPAEAAGAAGRSAGGPVVRLGEITADLPVTVSIGVAGTEDAPNRPRPPAVHRRPQPVRRQAGGRDQVVSGVQHSGRRRR